MKKSKVLLLVVLLHLSYISFSQKTDSTQKADSTKPIAHFGGAVTITNKGISLIPTFTLGKPAAIFDMNVGKGKLSFEPQFRFALSGKPWSIIFWWRYKLANTAKFRMNIGAHPSMVFKTISATVNGKAMDVIQTHRYFATEVSPNYFVTKNTSIGMYYLYSHGLDEGTTGNTHFITLNSNFSHIKISEQFFAKFNPQVYYLKQDAKDGVYFTSTVTLAKKNFPFTLQSIMNKVISTNIPSQNFVWNVSLVYSFNKNYVSRK